MALPTGLPRLAPMPSTIVVGVDGRPGGRDALLLAQRLAGPDGSLVAVHVNGGEDEGHALLRGELAATGVFARPHVVTGSAVGRALHDVAAANAAALVVVGRPHRGALGRIAGGDTVRAVVRRARCAVAVTGPPDLPPPAEPIIGVGIDGSAAAAAALWHAAALARTLEASVHVLSAVEPSTDFAPSALQGVNWASQPVAHEAQARELVDDALAALDGPATGEVVIGAPAAALKELSHRVSLLVLGSRGEGAINRTLLGSTSDALVHGAHCPVVVVPAGAVGAGTPVRTAAGPA